MIESLEARQLLAVECMAPGVFAPPFQSCLANAGTPLIHDVCCTFTLEGGTWANVTALSNALISYGQPPCCPDVNDPVCSLLKDYPSHRLCDLLMELNPYVQAFLRQIAEHLEKEADQLKNNNQLDIFVRRHISRVLG